jgi:hypothetical protein
VKELYAVLQKHGSLTKYRVFVKYTSPLSNYVTPEPDGLSSCSQEPAIRPYSELPKSIQFPPASLLKSNLVPSTHLRLGLRNGVFPSGFPTKMLYTFLSSPILATIIHTKN